MNLLGAALSLATAATLAALSALLAAERRRRRAARRDTPLGRPMQWRQRGSPRPGSRVDLLAPLGA